MAVVVSGLALTLVKGTRLRTVDRIRLGHSGVAENRRFYWIDARGRMVNAKHLGALNTVLADYADSGQRLRLTFPDGAVVEDVIRAGETVETLFYSERAAATLVDGPFSAALSMLVGQPLRLVEASDIGGGVDRGADGSVSLISRASLARLAEVADEPDVDSRRFRMLIEVEGLDAHAEDEWVGREVGIGEATVRFSGHVGRCLITSRHPETGIVDLPTLDIIRGYRSDARTTEPLPFGIWGKVLQPGTIALGDAVVVRPA